ncbi:MAG: DUF1836 domain-containing protein [Erysipelothrix sp.]|nr:DUF1836 domain-containing protein [Erysipelothrix sp.]
MKDYEEWVKRLMNFRLPRFDELPEIALYLDQVIEYVNEVLADLHQDKREVITRSMVNNYVKHKIMPAPHKKRYTNEHIAYIIVISTFKSIMSLNNIDVGIQSVLSGMEPKLGYDVFVEYVESSIRGTIARILREEDSKWEPAHDGMVLLPLKIASLTFAGKTLIDNFFDTKEEKI